MFNLIQKSVGGWSEDRTAIVSHFIILQSWSGSSTDSLRQRFLIMLPGEKWMKIHAETREEKKRRERDNRSAAAGWEENGLHAQVHQQFNFQIALWNPTQAAELGCQRIRGRLSVRHDCSGANLPLLWVLLEKWVDHWLLETNSLSQSVQYVKTRSGETLKKECSSHFKAEFFNLWVATPFGVTWKV